MAKVRLDQLVVNRGLAASRERARALILARQISVEGATATKAGTFVDEAVRIHLRSPEHPWVGRGGVKLAHALDVFGVDPIGAVALDIGASTGGFTDVLLQRGARLVVALDVGHGQLDWRLRRHPNVVVRERVNARTLRVEDLPETARRADLVTIDVSFISLKHILPALPPILAPAASVIALVKPQFEAGRHDVGKGGVVRDPEIHARVVNEVAAAADAVGLERIRMEPSPIEGTEGNREFFLLLRPREPVTTEP